MLTAFYTVTTISLVIACGFAVYGRNRRGLVSRVQLATLH